MTTITTSFRPSAVASECSDIKISHKRKWQVINDKPVSAATAGKTGMVRTRRDRGKATSLFAFMESIIERLHRLGRYKTSYNYRSALNSFATFRQGVDIDLRTLNADIIEEYEAWLASRGVCPNSISFYMRILRATYSRAVKSGITKNRVPFADAYCKIDKTAKRAISLKDIRSIKNLDLEANPSLAFMRDIFMFQFYTRGMNLIDVAYLKRSDLTGNEITYRRHKTGQQITVGLNKHISGIIRRHASGEGKYLFPIITKEGAAGRRQYQSYIRRMNYMLKEIGILAKISTNISTYTTRHSWASIAKNIGIPTSIISDALGHDSEQTTQIYLASIATKDIDRANERILKEL